jgi:hypothetical protein
MKGKKVPTKVQCPDLQGDGEYQPPDFGAIDHSWLDTHGTRGIEGRIQNTLPPDYIYM